MKEMNLFRITGSSVVMLFHPRILILVLLPIVGSLLVWSLVGYYIWLYLGPFISTQISNLEIHIESIRHIFEFIQNQSGSFFSTLGFFIFMIVLIPFVWMTAVLLTSIFAMPVIVRIVHNDSFSHVEKRGKTNAMWWLRYLRLSILFFVLWFLSLPLLLIPILGFLAPLLVTAYFHYRICLMDALSDYATETEMHQVRTQYKPTAVSLGFISAFFLSIPFWNLLSPIVSALLFTRFGFEALSEVRQNSLKD